MAEMTTQTHDPRHILGGNFPLRFDTVTVAQGGIHEAGTVLGEITASGNFIPSLAAAADGSENPSVILWETIDATAGAVDAEVLLCGDVLASSLTIGTGHTVASVKKALRAFSLYVHE